MHTKVHYTHDEVILTNVSNNLPGCITRGGGGWGGGGGCTGISPSQRKVPPKAS